MQKHQKDRIEALFSGLAALHAELRRLAVDVLAADDVDALAARYPIPGLRKRSSATKTATCKHCHREYEQRHWARQFCSPECSSLARRSLENDRICPQCGNMFTARGKRKYCFDCKENLKTTRPPKPCKVCGEIFKPAQRAQKFCKKECKQAWFNKNKAKDSYRKRLLRDVGKCEYCGVDDRKSLHTHHINGRSAPELMVLCANCHYKYHVTMGNNVFSETRSREDVLAVLRSDDLAVSISQKAA